MNGMSYFTLTGTEDYDSDTMKLQTTLNTDFRLKESSIGLCLYIYNWSTTIIYNDSICDLS